jgi:cephalosporin-C deacetylase-like acetyl esterase
MKHLAVFMAAVMVCSVCAQELVLTPLKASGIYDVGEKVGWTIVPSHPTTAPAGKYTFTLKKNNFETIKSGDIDLSTGSATIDATVSEPAMLFLDIKPPTGKDPANKDIVAGAAIAPTKLQPVAPRPADFDSFWESHIQSLEKVPANPVLTPGDSPDPNVEFDIIKMDHVNGKHIYGQFAKPKKDGKYPALVQFQWASPPYPLQKSWIMGYAANGWLALDIEPHDVLPDQPKAYYDALPKELKNYQAIGEDDREKSYFLQMYLADYRAIDYLASRPDWDGKTLVVIGTSMGGQQSLCVAGLHPKITHVIVNEPSGCDTNSALHGRQSGYPNFPANNPKVMETALYFDAVNFTPRIHAKSLVAMGFVDTVAPPVGIWTAFNEIPAPKEPAPMIDSPHNNLATPAQQKPYTSRSAKWLDSLVRTGDVRLSGD